MKRLILALALTAIFATSAVARPTPGQEQQLSPAEIKALRDLAQKLQAPQPAAVAKPAPPAAIDSPPVVVAPVAAPTPPAAATVPFPAATAPPVTQNTVTTTGPVSSDTTISIGTLAGQVLTWAAAAFGSVGATVFTAWGVRLFKLAGVQMSDAARARLQDIIVNGLNVGAAAATQNLAGKDKIQIKNETVAQAIAYTQAHGADAIKQLGLDPNSGAAIEAIKARIETAIADPAVPTPAVLDAPAVTVPQTVPAKA
jgi:hypothetical protein